MHCHRNLPEILPQARDWIADNKAFFAGRFGAGLGVGVLTGPIAGPSLAYQSMYDGAVGAIGRVVSQMERGGYDSSKLSDSTLGKIASYGIAGGSAKFDPKSGDVTATVKYTPLGSRIERTQTEQICNVDSERGC